MTTKYNRKQLIAAVKQEIENVMLQYGNDQDVTDVDIRLQLVDGTYYIHIGDIKFDSDHRGSFGYGTVITETTDKYKPTPSLLFEDLAEEIVDEALEDWENNKIFQDIDDEFQYKL